ncbi:hypothetical protein AB6D66_00625 [Vibrio pomeroyi]|uniref:AI-2E family transporter n=1 Tax=Vibrio pomeroyi TaxID=198832 RepID=A0ABV4MQZ0_9VIBR|nr:hypothetical protein [Vibrio atlanticus]MCZ4311054.1 hypothetical protein [Vibrio atlanticus]
MFNPFKNRIAAITLAVLVILFVAYQIAKIAISLAVVYFVVLPIVMAILSKRKDKFKASGLGQIIFKAKKSN